MINNFTIANKITQKTTNQNIWLGKVEKSSCGIPTASLFEVEAIKSLWLNYIAYINSNATKKLKIPKASANAIPMNIVAV